MLSDKITVQQVLGSLIKRPQLLSEVDKYSLTISDFNTRFERYIFNAILGLYSRGAVTITAIDIDNFLESNEGVHKIFEQQNGLEYIEDIIEFSNVENFNFYYNKLKKLNLLRDLKKQGIDISPFYNEDLADPKAAEVNKNFEQLTTSDIINSLRTRIITLEREYKCSEEVQVESIADGLDGFLDEIQNSIEIGKKVQGKIYSKVINGAERGALTIRSGSSGLGKTRQAVGDACFLAFPLRFNWNTDSWEQIGSNEKVLFIVTEQTFKQVRKMVFAYLTGINESKFKYNRFTDREKVVILQAQKILKRYEENLTLIKIPNPTIELVKTLVRENCLTKDIGYVFYDYVFIGPALLNEFKGISLRNDEVLLMFATALKDLAVELNVCMMTSTQVNANADDNRNIRNEATLAGGRSTINKADNGAIMARPTAEELEILNPIITKMSIPKPNMVTDIFKVRSGEWSQVRIWSEVNLGTLRKTDLFITDAQLNPIEGFFDDEDYDVQDWTADEEIELVNFIESLNEGEIND